MWIPKICLLCEWIRKKKQVHVIFFPPVVSKVTLIQNNQHVTEAYLRADCPGPQHFLCEGQIIPIFLFLTATINLHVRFIVILI